MRWLIYVGMVALAIFLTWFNFMFSYFLGPLGRFANQAVAWYVTATLPTGIARFDRDGEVYLADTGWLAAAVFWAVSGLIVALALRRLRLALYAPLAFVLVLAIGTLAFFTMQALGVGPHLVL